MTANNLLTLTKKLINKFYSSGNFDNILSLMDETTVGFSSHFFKYSIGKKDLISFFQQEYKHLSPCRIVDNYLSEKYSKDDKHTIKSDIILYVEKIHALKYYRILIMYKTVDNCIHIYGIHILESANENFMNFNHLHKINNNDVNIPNITNFHDKSIRQARLIYTIGRNNSIQFYDNEFSKMLGYSPNDILTTMKDLIYDADLKNVHTKQQHQLTQNDTYQLKYRLKTKSGFPVYIIESGYKLIAENNTFILNSIIIDVSPLKEINDYFVSCLFYDNLTGIYNKETFYKQTHYVIIENDNIPFELMCIDIERFKIINEVFGKKTGNNLLIQISEFLKHAQIDFLVYGRLYADKFILCYPAQNNNRNFFINSLKNIASNFKSNYKVILCFGIYSITDRNISVSVMCDKANLALKKVKGHYIVPYGKYDEKMHQILINEQSFVNDMNFALINNEFTFYLQPKYEMNTKKILGAEALVRWIHPTKGFIGPDKFIPIFEQNGFILQLDKYIWEEVCKLLKKWHDNNMPLYPISINISRIDLYSDNLVSFLDALVKKYDIPPHFLELELTESAYINNAEQIITITKELQSIGFIILMDDFGSGFSSLNMLKDVNVNVLKIDLKFLQGTDQSSRSGKILNSIVHMAKTINLPVIIEGVETQQQAEFLRSIGCNWAQGYYYSKPLSVDDYEAIISKSDYKTCITNTTTPGKTVNIEEFFNPNTKFNLLFNSMTCGIGIYEYSTDGLQILRANDSYLNMFNYDLETFYSVNRHILNSIHKEDQHIFLQSIEKTCQKDIVTQCYIRRYTSDQHLLYLHLHISRIVKEKEYCLLYISIESYSQFDNDNFIKTHVLLDNIPAAFCIYELCGNDFYLRQTSRQLSYMTGCTPQKLMMLTNSNINELFDKKSLILLKKAIDYSCSKNITVHVKHLLKTVDEGELTIISSINARKTKAGNLICYAYLKKASSKITLFNDLYPLDK
ncbi:EAL domain-containing protein [Pectinatus sottacetonis]|uniref:EAL domain-containing protein n=1 Tax=Pectinatus sottacetonis TaxID=1002795 RepID=UPI0018C7072B|nr:EAL domain-containing protein [Pectinatus sottacetonis]